MKNINSAETKKTVLICSCVSISVCHVEREAGLFG